MLLSKLLLGVFVALGVICALVILSYGWIIILSRGSAGVAVDIALLLRSPLYWLFVAGILACAWVASRRWLF
jgi:hypothetical protein